MSLEIIMGCMYSGKSTELMRRVRRLQSIGMRCLVVNHTNDVRVQGDFVQSHTGHKMSATKTDDIMLVDGRAFDAVAIDEAQFFSNLKSAVLLLVQKYKKHVIVAGLNGDYRRATFGELLELVPHADDILFTRALCSSCCHPGRPASFTKRISDETETVSVQGTYRAVCRVCLEKE